MSDPRTAGNVLSFPGPGSSAAPPPPAAPSGGAPPFPAPPGPAMAGPAALPPHPPPAAPGLPPAGPGFAPAGMPAPIAPPPGMVINPAFLQWRMLAQLWHAEDHRRKEQFAAACRLIRHDVCNGYKIDIEADSTIAADELAEKQARTEFLQSILPMLQLLIPQAQQQPASVGLIHALVMFGVRAFPAARGLEQEFEDAFHNLLKAPQQPPPPKGNVKTPAEIASEERIATGDQRVDAQENQIKAAQVQVQQQKNSIDMFKAYLQSSQSRQAQQQDAWFRAAEVSQQGQELQDRSELNRARLTHLLSRDTAGLV